MIKNKDELADRLKGIKVGDKDLTIDLLKEVLSKEDEVELTIEKVNVLNNDQLEEIKNNVREEQKTLSYGEGKTAGQEMTIKDLKKMWGIEKDGKSPESLFKYVNDKVATEAKVPVDEKVKELNSSLDSLRKTYESDKENYENKLKQKEGELNSYKITTELIQHTPQDIKGISPKQAATLFKTDHLLEYDDTGGIVVKKEGKVLKDAMEKPFALKDVYTDYLKSNNWLGGDGRGGGNEPGSHGSKFKTKNDLYKHMDENKIEIDSVEGMALIDKFEAETKA